MKTFVFKKEMLLPVSVSDAWNFFSNPSNLKRITPPEMNFEILTKNLPDKIYSGLMIEYTVTPLFGIKMKWVTEITEVSEPNSFSDNQHKGPYAKWSHTHRFTAINNGTLMEDEVHYSLPLSFLGDIAHSLFVRRKIESIFNYRAEVIAKLFSDKKIAA
jgi:ligand-binding SRPBCC domain-containing protein